MILLSPTHWEVRQTKSKGKGIFATKRIQPGIVISDYLGTVLRTATDDTNEKDGLYLMYYHDYASIYPNDLNAQGAHLLNHSCMPNCWIYTYYGHTLFFTLRTIFPGEELTIKYLLPPLETCRDCIHQCFCMMRNCTGTMHLSQDRFESWQAFSNLQATQTKRKRIRYHLPLPPLPHYPKEIADNPLYDLFGSITQPPVVANEKNVSVEKARAILRETGRTIALPMQKKTLIGISENKYIFN